MPRSKGWLIDDAWVAGERWSQTDEWEQLWEAFAADCPGAPVRFVCPTYEGERASVASGLGFTVEESWWLAELPGSGGAHGLEIDLPGASALTVGAPPVYAPPGPILFMSNLADSAAVPVALERAVTLGCAGVVVNQRADDVQLGLDLEAAGLRRHCDFYHGELPPAY